jgi:apolipoprotein N-acyltransferase
VEWRRIVLAALAGLLLSFAFEPLALPWLLPPAVAAFVLSTRGLSPRRGWQPGLAFGVAFYFTHIEWMTAVGLSAWLGLAAAESLFYGVMGAYAALVQRHRLWPLWFAAGWTAVETWRSTWPFSGMPWGRLAFAVVDTPVARSLPYVGMVAVSFLLALLGALLAWLVRGLEPGHDRRRLGAGLLVALCGLLAVPDLHPWQARTTGHVTVAVVQGNVPGDGDDILYDYVGVTRNHAQATIDLARRVEAGTAPRPDFVIWPENSTAVDPFKRLDINAAILSASHAIDVPILVGAIVDADAKHALNQGIVWDPVTGAGERYTKWHPVPYGEYIPFRALLEGHNFGRLAVVSRDIMAGTRVDPLDVGGTPVADAICFDIAYDDDLHAQLTHGAQLLVVQTSNATFIHTDQIQQQFAITRLRALETGRWIAVASTNGITGIIDPEGHVVDSATPQTQAVLDDTVGLVSAVTPAMRLGTWPARLAMVLGAGGLLSGLLTYRRRDERDRPPEEDRDDEAPSTDDRLVGAGEGVTL